MTNFIKSEGGTQAYIQKKQTIHRERHPIKWGEDLETRILFSHIELGLWWPEKFPPPLISYWLSLKKRKGEIIGPKLQVTMLRGQP